MPATPGPKPVDTHVGARIRLRRKYLSMSQSALAASLGLTFQQVQKYERGANRVSASMLFATAQTLGVSINYFFEGIEGQPDDPGVGAADIEAMRAYQAVPQIAAIPTMSRENQLALGRVIAAMTATVAA